MFVPEPPFEISLQKVCEVADVESNPDTALGLPRRCSAKRYRCHYFVEIAIGCLDWAGAEVKGVALATRLWPYLRRPIDPRLPARAAAVSASAPLFGFCHCFAQACFELFAQQLALLGESDSNFERRFLVLESLATLKTPLLLVELLRAEDPADRDDSLLIKLFEALLSATTYVPAHTHTLRHRRC